ncbi:MAG: S-layer homology domain-containing protein [Firmicutes bacterium]|nr:S-layer homology domain-containing protein [Bacillota bacterium]
MKRSLKALALLLGAFMIMGLLSACDMNEYEIYVNNDGSVDLSYGLYASENFLSTVGKTPQEFYEAQIKEGKTLSSINYDGETYWGVTPDNDHYDNISAFIEALEENDRMRASVNLENGKPYMELEFTVPAASQAAEEAGVQADLTKYSEAVTYLSIDFPGECKSAVFPRYGTGELTSDKTGYLVFAEYGEEAYTVKLSGWLDENMPIFGLEFLRVEVDTPAVGKTPSELKNTITGMYHNVGHDMIDNTYVYWYVCDTDSSDPEDWMAMSELDPFEAGKFYRVEYFVYDVGMYFPIEYTTVTVNEEPSDNIFHEKMDEFGGAVCGALFHVEEPVSRPASGTPSRPSTGGGSPVRPSTGGATGQPADPAAPADPAKPADPAAPTNPFTDVAKTDYFYEAVDWAFNAEPQITDGNGADKFMPDQTCTRGQVVTFLYRTLKFPLITSEVNPFGDVKNGDYFYSPVLWAVENKVTEGTTPTTFRPANPCTNAQILTFIWRAMGRPDNKGSEATAQYWKDAYNWAVSKGMLEGTGVTEATINEPCPRKNVVQFLYLYSEMNK